jgi:hypothetical protein
MDPKPAPEKSARVEEEPAPGQDLDRCPRCGWQIGEILWGHTDCPNCGLRYLKTRFPEAEAWQLSAVGGKDFQTREGIRVAPALALLKTLV